MPVDHAKAIAHMNKQLEKFGVVSFSEVNKAGGGAALHSRHFTKGYGATIKEINSRRNLIVVQLPTGRSSANIGKNKLGTSYHVIKKDLGEFLKFASIMGNGQGMHHPIVTALFNIEGQRKKKGCVILDLGLRGTRMLVDMGLLERIRFVRGKKPEGAYKNQKLFKVLKPNLIKRAIAGAKRVIELQKGRHG